jgi:galactose mutarotase-like enzyme
VPPPHETKEVLYQGYPAHSLISPEAQLEATFAPGIGMIGCSLTHGGDELLGQRGGLARYEATGSTMGIPFLHPWSNRLAGYHYSAAGKSIELDKDSPLIHQDPNGLPIHGLLAACPYWELVGTDADFTSARLLAHLDYAAHPELLEGFPFPHELRIEVNLKGPTLTLRTALAATGDGPVPVSFGYHPYLRLPGVDRADWQVEIPVTKRLALDERMIPTGETEPVTIEPGPLGDRTFDDGYTGLGEHPRFVLAGGGRRITVEFGEGYPYAQVYAPDDDDVICFEPMTAPTNALVSGEGLSLAAPGDTCSATFSITVEPA